MKELLKEIRKDLRVLKNQWIFKSYFYKEVEIQTKRYNNWFQIFRSTKGNINFTMFNNQKEVLYKIEEFLKGWNK